MNLEQLALTANARTKISLDAKPSTVYGVFSADPNESSRFLACLAGAETSLFGRVLIDGQALSSNRSRIGYLPNGNPFPREHTVWELFEFLAKMKGVKASDRFLSIGEALALVELSHAKKRLISSLTSAELTRLGVVQAWIGKPDVLILDCQTSGLPASEIRVLRRVIRRFADHGACVFLALARPGDLFGIADRFLVLDDGEVKGPLDHGEILSGSTVRLTALGEPRDLESFFDISEHICSYRMLDRAENTPIAYLLRSRRSGIADSLRSEMEQAGFDVGDCTEEPLGEAERILRRAGASAAPTAKEKTK